VWKFNKIEVLNAFGAFSEPFDVNTHSSAAFQIIINIIISFNFELLEMLWSVLEEFIVRTFAENSSVGWEIWFEFGMRAILIHSVENLFDKLIIKCCLRRGLISTKICVILTSL